MTALDGLDLTVPRHSIFGFLGPNGAGKTTTMKLLLGVLFNTRPPLLGIALASLLGGSLIPVEAVVQFTPWKLGQLAISLMMGATLPPTAMTMLVSTAVWSVVFIAVAIWQFNRLEL